MTSLQTDVSRATDERFRSGRDGHVLRPVGLYSGGLFQVEVRQRRVDDVRKIPASPPAPGQFDRLFRQWSVRPSGLAELRRSLDEGAGRIRQSQTLQQAAWTRPGLSCRRCLEQSRLLAFISKQIKSNFSNIQHYITLFHQLNGSIKICKKEIGRASCRERV